MRYYPNDLSGFERIMRGSDHAELRALAAIVEHGPYVRPAEHLGMSASSLCQTKREFEERIGVRLLTRTSHSVAPSEAVTRRFARCHPASADLDAVGGVLTAPP